MWNGLKWLVTALTSLWTFRFHNNTGPLDQPRGYKPCKINPAPPSRLMLDSSWNVMAHGDAHEKWRGNWRMECVASTLHNTSERGVSSITTADAQTSSASSRLNWRPRRFKWTRPFRRKTKSGFCAFAITFQLASKTVYIHLHLKTNSNDVDWLTKDVLGP
jgi:hypothetical protein